MKPHPPPIVQNAILQVARTKPEFTITEIPIERSLHHLGSSCYYQVKRGVLRIVKPGKRGRIGFRHTVFTLNTKGQV